MQAFEIGQLWRVTGTDQNVKSVANKRGCSAAEHRLLAKKISLGFFAEGGFDYSCTRATDSFRPCHCRRAGAPGEILFDGDERGHAAAALELTPHHRSQRFRRDHDNIDIGWRHDRFVKNSEAMREKQCLPGAQIRCDLSRENFWHSRIGERQKNNITALDSLFSSENRQTRGAS